MIKYKIHLRLVNENWYLFIADSFCVIDSKLEINIMNSIISFDFDLITDLEIFKKEEEPCGRDINVPDKAESQEKEERTPIDEIRRGF